MKIIAGNGTYLAAKNLGWKDLSVVKTSLSAEECIAYGIADNRLGELSDFDDEALSRALASLESKEFPIEELGFNEKELAEIIQSEFEIEVPLDDDKMPEGIEDDHVEQPTSHVRMVQLFFNEETIDQFTSMVKTLSSIYGTRTTTDTVFACLENSTTALHSNKT